MKVLITGGTGTISSGLVQASLENGNETYAITRGTNKYKNIEGAKYLYADIWNKKKVESVLGDKKFDVVVECLAMDVKQLKKSLDNFAERCDKYFFISTAGIYSRKRDGRIKEVDSKNFEDWLYTKNKIECENFLKDYSRQYGLKFTIIRPTVTYGDYRVPFPIATRSPGWTFFDRIQKGELMLASDNVKYSIIHIHDFSKMVISLFDNNKAVNEDYHIASNNNDIYWDDVITTSGKLLDIEPKIVHVSAEHIREVWPSIYEELALNKNLSLVLDDTKIRETTGVTAEINLETGITQIIDSMKRMFDTNNDKLDFRWNDYCNATIYHAYINGYLCEDEKQTVKNYIDNYGSDIFLKSIRNVGQYNRDVVKQAKIYKIKKVIKRILNR